MKSKNEIAKFLNNYFCTQIDRSDGTIRYRAISSTQKSFSALINALIESNNFDRPDGYFFDSETSTLYIFEHFEFDCSKNSKKGSKLRKNISKINEDIEEEIKCSNIEYHSVKMIEQGYGNKVGDTITYVMGANGDKYRDNYIENFKKAYESHSEKLNEYIERCIQEIDVVPRNIITTFLIEDITLGGTYYKYNNNIGNPVNLVLTKQFYETFKNSDIDCVFFVTLQNKDLTIYDKSMVNDSSIEYIDLLNEEFYIFPAMPKITYLTKSVK